MLGAYDGTATTCDYTPNQLLPTGRVYPLTLASAKSERTSSNHHRHHVTAQSADVRELERVRERRVCHRSSCWNGASCCVQIRGREWGVGSPFSMPL